VCSTIHPADLDSWERTIREAVTEPDPVLANLKITRCHYLLGRALGDVLGADAGANFHSWAVWGSRKAGVTIRQEDLDQARRDGTRAGGVVGTVVGLALGWLLLAWVGWAVAPALAVVGGACGALTGRGIIARSRRVSARLILDGNRTVLADIGALTARFVARFHDQPGPDARALADFLAGVRPGPAAAGGQELLRRAFGLYHAARFAAGAAGRQEATYLANCLAVCHEHVRLEPYIRGSMPWIVRRCVTKRLLQFDVGPVRLAVAHDVPSLAGLAVPASLATLTNRDAVSYLDAAGGCALDDGRGDVGARDWTKMRERMRYIFKLFRLRHLDPGVVGPPYEPAGLAAIAAGGRPAGRL
jgi:hypothetical protein